MPNYTILLVDYEPRSVERSRRPLVDAGFKVHLAPDGVAALESFERLKPDLVLIEAMLPKKNGFEVCQELRQTPNGKTTPILITTAVYRGRKYRSQALHVHGASEYIEKPIADDQLIAIVRRFLQGTGKRPARIEDEAAPTPATASERPAKPIVASTPPTPVTMSPTKTPAAAVAAIATQPVRTTAPIVKSSPPAVATAVAANAPASGAETAVSRAERAAPVLVDETPVSMPVLPGASAPAGSAASATWRAAANAMVGGLTEDEISERLDALLPLGRDAAESTSTEQDQSAPDAYDLEAAAEVLAETDPDFDAGNSMDAVTLTEPLVPLVSAESTDVAERATAENASDHNRPDADVVRFDARRSKKRGKKSKNKPDPIPQPPVVAKVEPLPLAVEPRTAVATNALPAKTAEEIEPLAAPRRRGIPFWVWLLVLIAIAAGAYFAFFRDTFTLTEQSTPAPDVTAPNHPTPSTPPPPMSDLPMATQTVGEQGDDPSVAETASTDTPASVMGSETTPSSVPAATAPPTQTASLASSSPAPSRATASSSTKTRQGSSGGRKESSRLSSIGRDTPMSASMSPGFSIPAPAAPATANPAVAAPPGDREPDAPTISAEPASNRTTGAVPEPVLGAEPMANHAPAPAEPTPSRPVNEGDLVPLASADQPPIAVSRPAPAYPKQARADGVEGEVSLSLLIDESGKVADIRVINAATYEFGSAASSVARTWTYKPAVKNGVRIKVWKPERVIFKL